MYINASSAKTNITKRNRLRTENVRADNIHYFGKYEAVFQSVPKGSRITHIERKVY